MPALINLFFGGDLEGLFGATPFEVLHQLLLGIFKYILESLYNYRTIPEEWTCFFKERKSPDIPENISDHKRNTETTDSAFLDQEQPKKRAKTKKERHTHQLSKISTLAKIKNQHLYQHQKRIFETIVRTKC